MAERRMFAKTIVMSDAFIELPHSARSLYIALGMVADDDGFVNNPKSIMRQIESSKDDLDILIQSEFLIAFESGVVAIKAWRINNYIQKDRYTETKYITEKSNLQLNGKGMYTLCIQDVSKMYTQDRIGKYSIGQYSVVESDIEASASEPPTEAEEKSTPFLAPTLKEVQAYAKSRGHLELAKKFYDYFSEGDWIDSKGNPVRNWKQKFITWCSKEEHKAPTRQLNFDPKQAMEKAMERSYGK
jgi:hypothetical protein